MQIDVIFFLVVLIFSTVLHELAHGYMANYLGDPTAKFAGRLTLNPLKHIDLVGTILLPLLLQLSGSSILIGYAKPVPYNPYNLRGRFGETLVALAGPLTNILLALIFGLLIRFSAPGAGSVLPPIFSAFATIAFVNMLLALFNLIPIPPLDGSKVLSGILPGALGRGYAAFRAYFERLGVFAGTLFILLLFFLLSPFFSLILSSLFRVITGL